MADLEQARAAKARLRATLSGHSGVTGIGLTRVRQGWGVKVNVETSDACTVPRAVDGVPVQVSVVGRIHAHR